MISMMMISMMMISMMMMVMEWIVLVTHIISDHNFFIIIIIIMTITSLPFLSHQYTYIRLIAHKRTKDSTKAVIFPDSFISHRAQVIVDGQYIYMYVLIDGDSDD